MAAYGSASVVINTFLQNPPGSGANFTTVLLLVDQATNSLDGDRYRVYTRAKDAEDDETAGFISASVAQGLTDAFAQPRVKEILVGRVDLVGTETYATALDACIDAGAGFYGVCADTRVGATQVILAGAVETDEFRFCMLQSDDADWLTATYPAAYTALEGDEHNGQLYHDDDTEWGDLCYLANRLAFDPDERSAGWRCSVDEVENYATALTSTQKGHALTNNVNLGEEWGDAAFWVDPGYNNNGRAIDHIVSVDWFKTRAAEDIRDLIQAKAARGEKLTVDQRGADTVKGLVQARAEQAIAAGHVLRTQDSNGEDLPEILATYNETTKKITVTARLVFASNAQEVEVNLYFFETTP